MFPKDFSPRVYYRRICRALGCAATVGIVFALSLLAGCKPETEHSEGVRLLLTDDTLEANATFEIRFDQPVAAADEVGRTATHSPLIIQPPLAGQFVWLSQRSGVFTPTEPSRLGTEYRLSLRSGLMDPEGHSVKARLLRKVHTPPFGVAAQANVNFSGENLPPDPTLAIQFNAQIDTNQAAAFFTFVNSNGAAHRATVETVNDYKYNGANQAFAGNDRARIWEEQFQVQRKFDSNLRHRKASADSAKVETATNLIVGRFLVRPGQPLPPGNDWKLVINAGLPAAPPLKTKMPATWIFPLGNIQPFVVTEIEGANAVNAGRRVRLHFSKSLSPDLNATNLLDWVQITPHVTNLAASTGWENWSIKGDFELFKPYRIRVKAGLTSGDGLKLAEDVEQEITFKPVPPRLYWPTLATDQLSRGQRRLELLTINVDSVRLRAKLLDEYQLIHALRGYKGYFKERSWDDDSYEPYREIDFNLMAGKTVCWTNFAVDSTQDQPMRTVFSWDNILGGRTHGAVFLAAEKRSPTDSADNPNSGGPAVRAALGTQTLLQLTDLGLYWKTMPGRLWVAVFSHTTGKPVAGAKVRILNNDGEVLAEHSADEAGLAQFDPAPKNGWLLAKAGDDLHALALEEGWENRIPVDNAIPRVWNESGQETGKLLLFSDRPVYRPGETLHLKAILREFTNGTWTVPLNATGKLVCLDARQRPFFETNVVFSALGSCDVSVMLPGEKRGTYRADLTVSTNLTQYHSFEVQDYQPNVFEISLPVAPSVAASEPVAFPVKATYLHGRPVSKARLAWNINAHDEPFAPDKWEHFVFCNRAHTFPGEGGGSLSINGETNFVSALGWALKPEIPINPVSPQPRTVNCLVEMTDASQQTLTASAQLIRHSSDFYLGIQEISSLVGTNVPTPVSIVAVRPDGTPEPAAGKIKLRLRKVNWRSVRVQGAGQVVRYENSPEFVDVNEQEVATTTVVDTLGQWSVADTTAPSVTLPPLEAGMYLLEASTTDRNGRPVLSAINFHVAGRGHMGWNYRNELQVDLAPDKPFYTPGQTATILVKTPISGLAFVSVEREHVMRSFATNLTGNAPAIQVPLLPGDAPNAIVTVFIARGLEDSTREFKEPEYRVGQLNLAIADAANQLKVEAGTENAQYQPGQNVVIEGTVRDSHGQPAAGAEVSCYAVDDGVLALTGYQVPNPSAFFWEERPLAVSSYSSLPSLLPEDPATWRFQNKGYLVGGGGDAAARALRKKFLGCAYWNPSLITDDQGQFTASFTAPDSLTRYRVIAVAHHGGGQFGATESTFQINKPLMLEPSLPRFAHVGDRLLARAVLQNRTTQPMEVEVALNVDDKAMVSAIEVGAAKTNQKTKVAANGEATVEFAVEMVQVGVSRWTWEAKTTGAGGERDRVESLLPVEYATPLLHEVYVSRTTSAATNLLAGANPQMFEGSGSLTVTLANSRLVNLGESVAGLLHYPYGCAEQTSSSLLPWIMWQDCLAFMPQWTNRPDAKAAIAKGVSRLFSMQTENGGLAYWPGGKKAEPWISAYAGMVLALARNSGHSVPNSEFDLLMKYLAQSLRDNLNSVRNEDLSGAVLALHTLALADRPESSFYERIYEKREVLSAESRALLALAIIESKGPADLAHELLNPKTKPIAQGDTWFGCPEREMAVQLMGRLRAGSQNPAIEPLAEELFGTQKQGRWATTQGNAWALMAVADYVRKVESTHQASAGQLTWQSEKRSFQLPAKPDLFETAFAWATNVAVHELRLENPAQQNLYVRVAADFRPKIQRLPRESRGFALQREYALVDGDGEVHEFKNARVGDLVLVTLRLENAQTGRYVAIDDAVPSILEPINPRFTSRTGRTANEAVNEWWDDFHELRHDRALFFRDSLPAGQHVIRYLARVRAAGTALAPNAKVEEMYHPERFGTSEMQELQSQPLN